MQAKMSKVAKKVTASADDVVEEAASKATKSSLSTKNTAIASAGVGVAAGTIVGGGVDNVVGGLANVLGIPDLSAYFPYSVSSSACCCLVIIAGTATYFMKK